MSDEFQGYCERGMKTEVSNAEFERRLTGERPEKARPLSIIRKPEPFDEHSRDFYNDQQMAGSVRSLR